MDIINRFRVLETALRHRHDRARTLQPPLIPGEPGSGAKRPSIKWSAVPLALALTLGGASLSAGPAAYAAPGGMVSVTFDDGWASQYNNALPILNKYGIPATMYINSGSVDAVPEYMTQAQIKAFANRGDQIASHTVTHTDLTTLTPEQVNNELSQDKARLQQMFGSSAAVDFASPYGAQNQTTTAAVQKYYATQRNTNVGFNAQASFNPYNILVQNVESNTTAATVQGWVNTAKTNNTWLVLVYHEVGANIGLDVYHTDTAVLDSHMAAVKNSGLAMVTVRKGVEAMTSTTPPPPPPPAPTPTPTPTAAVAAINAEAAANTWLGAPSSSVVCGLINGGCFQMYQGNAILWSPATGAHYTVAAIRQKWAATGFEGGFLGYPISDEVGGLVNGGVYQLYQRGVIMWSPASGAHYTVGAIRQKWAATGFEGGLLGYPISDEVGGLVNGGVYQLYQRGVIMWSPASGAHYTVGAIRQKWAATGFEGGLLGYPISDEVGGLVNGGVYQLYQRGVIMWSPASGAHYTLGAIRQEWAASGFERGFLGYPISDEVGGLVNGGVYQLYQRGVIMWSPASGAHYTVGAIRQTWASTGFERGRLGYPITGEYAFGSGVAQNYQGGRISWTAGGGAVIAYK